MLQTWFISTYRISVHSQVTRPVMGDREVNFATALLLVLKGPCHLPRRKVDPSTWPLPSLQWIQSPRWMEAMNSPSLQLSCR